MLILQSASPRRKELLHKITDDFKVESVPANECVIPSRPAATVMKNAREKALAIKPENGQTVVGADTVVYLAGRFFLKPKNVEEAFEMLKTLSGKWHSVYTGVCLATNGKVVCFYDKSAVKLKKMTDDEIKRYVETKNPLDKAGAYGIQDGVTVEKYTGSFDNVMGLPTEKLSAEIKKFLTDKED